MSIETAEELAGMERAGKVTRAVLNAMKTAVRPGICTRELDEVGVAVMRSMGARSVPKLVYSFPGESCISVNEEIVHGVPGERKLINGDLVKLDVTVEVGGFMADACETIGVGSIKQESKRLIDCVFHAFQSGFSAVRPGARAFDIGKEIHKTVQVNGYSVVRNLTGHGIGRTIHERPTIPNDFDPRCSDILTDGLVFTIEPLIAVGTPKNLLKNSFRHLL